MRLRDLDGWFVSRVTVTPKSYWRQEDIDGAQGVLFQCPLCLIGKPPGEGGGFAGAHYVQVCFANPRNALVAPEAYDDSPRWTVSGTSLDDLTLSPSIDLNPSAAQRAKRRKLGLSEYSGCGWHGSVTNGDAK